MMESKRDTPATRPSSMAEAYAQYTPRLRQYLLRLLRDPRRASDVVQETFKRFAGRAERAEAIRDPLAFLLGMARNVVREIALEERRAFIRFDSESMEQRADALDQASPANPAEELAVQDDIVRALRKLPPAHLAVLMLIESDGMSYEEAAFATGFTRNTVATYLMQARARLRALLEDERT